MTVRQNSEFVLQTIVDNAQRDQLSREYRGAGDAHSFQSGIHSNLPGRSPVNAVGFHKQRIHAPVYCLCNSRCVPISESLVTRLASFSSDHSSVPAGRCGSTM